MVKFAVLIIFGYFAVSHGIKAGARIGIENVLGCGQILVGFPIAESRPMAPKCIDIYDGSKDREVSVSSKQVSSFWFAKASILALGIHKTRNIFVVFSRERNSTMVRHVASSETQGRGLLSVYNFHPDICVSVKHDAFPNVNFFDGNRTISQDIWPHKERLNPSTFIAFKIVSKVVPLKPSGARINDYKNEREYFHNETFFVPGFLSFFGGITLLCKVWWNCSFNLTSNLNVAGHVTLVMLCACLILLGMWLVGTGLGMFT